MRPRVAIGLDWLALTLGVGAVVMAWTGGFYTEVGGVRLSMRNPDRALIPAAIVLGIRWWFASGVRPFGVERPRWQRWRARLFQPAADPVDRPAWPGWTRAALATLGILAFGAILLQPQLRHMDAVPDFGDPLFSMWRMGWVYEQWRGDPRPLFSGNIFHPAPLALTFSDSMLLPSATAIPLRAAGIHPVLAYNVLFLSAFVFSALATYLLVERLTGSPRAAFISALIYGFYPYRFEHYSHLELQMTHWMPLAMIWLHRFSATLKVRDAIAVALLAAAQLYSSMYYGVFFMLYAGAVLGTLLLARGAAAVAPAAGAGGVGARAGRRARGAARAAVSCRPDGQGRSRRGRGQVRQRGSVRLFAGPPTERDVRRQAARGPLSGTGVVSWDAAPCALRGGARPPGRGHSAGTRGGTARGVRHVAWLQRRYLQTSLPLVASSARTPCSRAHEHRHGDQPGRARRVRRAAAAGAVPQRGGADGRLCCARAGCGRGRLARYSSFTPSGGNRRRSTTRSRGSRWCLRSSQPG